MSHDPRDPDPRMEWAMFAVCLLLAVLVVYGLATRSYITTP